MTFIIEDLRVDHVYTDSNCHILSFSYKCVEYWILWANATYTLWVVYKWSMICFVWWKWDWNGTYGFKVKYSLYKFYFFCNKTVVWVYSSHYYKGFLLRYIYRYRICVIAKELSTLLQLTDNKWIQKIDLPRSEGFIVSMYAWVMCGSYTHLRAHET